MAMRDFRGYIQPMLLALLTLPPVAVAGSKTQSPGNGHCVTVGDETPPYKTYTWSSGDSTYQSTTTHQSDTRWTGKFEQTSNYGGFVGTTIGEQYNEYQIIKGFQYLTKMGSSSSNYRDGVMKKKSQSTVSYSPPALFMSANQYCEQQRWTSKSVTQTITSSQTFPSVSSNTFTTPSGSESCVVEAINEAVSVPAGSFNTVRIHCVNDSEPHKVRVNWISIDHSTSVKLGTLTNGKVTIDQELISIH